MARKAFYSFHYVPDNWRASQVRNMGLIEGNKPVADNDWETIARGGDREIQKWIDDQLYGRSVAIVLIGTGTAGRKWINYEIKKAWDGRKGVIGVNIHNLKDSGGYQSTKGSNPFSSFSVQGVNMANIVKVYDPPYSMSTYAYDHIKEKLCDWIETAIEIRSKYN
jgi:hypothetical protein